MTENGNDLPKGFKFFTGLCIFIGAVGLLVNGIFLVLSFAPGLPPKLKEVAPGFWLSTLHLTRDAGYIIGATKSKKCQEWAPKLLVICAATSLMELIYNEIMSLAKGEIQLTPVSISYLVIPFLLEGSIIYYFTRKSVTTYVTGSPIRQQEAPN